MKPLPFKTERILAALMSLTFLVFSLPKLTASDVSLRLFGKINYYLGWEGRWFMYFTGLTELAVGALVLTVLLVKATQPGNPKLWFTTYVLGLLGTVGTMSGAMFVEFAIRFGEDPALTILAFVLFSLAVFLVLPKRDQVLNLVTFKG